VIIGIEGVSCVGKTRLARELSAILGRTTVVPCYFHSVDDPQALPPIVAPTPEAQLAGLRQLLAVETVRRTRALAARARGRTVVMDRTADTLLAHTLAVSSMMRFGIEDTARSLVGRHVVAVPDVTLLLTAPFEVRRARAAHRTGMPELLYARDFTDRFLAHFRDPIVPVCVRLDASQPVPLLAAQARGVIDTGSRQVQAARSQRDPA
jgi:dTMP kinase